MKKHFERGQRVRVRSEDKEHGGKEGFIKGFGNQPGYSVVIVQVEGVPKPVNFAASELIPL